MQCQPDADLGLAPQGNRTDATLVHNNVEPAGLLDRSILIADFGYRPVADGCAERRLHGGNGRAGANARIRTSLRTLAPNLRDLLAAIPEEYGQLFTVVLLGIECVRCMTDVGRFAERFLDVHAGRANCDAPYSLSRSRLRRARVNGKPGDDDG